MNRKIRIGFLSTNIAIGGSGVYHRNILNNLDPTIYEVFFFCNRKYPLKKVFGENIGFNVIYLGNELFQNMPRKQENSEKQTKAHTMGRKLWKKFIPRSIKMLIGFARDTLQLKNVLKPYRLDIFQSNEIYPYCEATTLSARLSKIPICIGRFCVLPQPKPWVYRLRDLFVFKTIGTAIFNTIKSSEEWTKRFFLPDHKIKIVSNGLNLSQFTPFTKSQKERLKINYDLPNNKFIIGMTARFEPVKGHKTLIEAAVKIIKVIPNVLFVFVGEGGYADELHVLIVKYNLLSYFRFMGYQSNIPELTNMYDIAVLPAIWEEAFGWVLIEAMACGKPVVATNVGGIPEVVEHGVTGTLVERENPSALAEAIIDLLQNTDKAQRMGQAGRQRVERLFTQEKMIMETLRLYEQLLNKNRYRFKVVVTSAKLEHITRGVETWARDTAHTLYEKGINVTLYKGSGPKRYPYEKALPSIIEGTVLSQRLCKILPKFLWHIGFGFAEQIEETTFSWSLIKETLQKKYDIIHTQDAHVAEALQFANRIGLIRSKIILGHGTEEPFSFLKKLDYVQHLAPYHQWEAEQNLGPHKGWFAIPNFVNTERFKPGRNPQLRRDLGIPEDAFVILSVAAIKPTHKRVDYLIKETAQLIAQGQQNVYLIVAGGKTSKTDEIIVLGKKLLGDRVRFLVNQTADKMPGIHNLADVFVLCSLKEMMPIALLEALSSGLPCLGNKYPVIEWMIGKGGECLDMAQPGKLVEIVPKYLDSSYHQERSQLARAHAVNSFSKEVVINQIIEMYTKVLQ